jgi:hypothetical protein
MPGETIDSLTLDIGLTSEEFQAGVNKVLGSMERMQSSAAETGDSMGASFASLGTSIAGLALRFAGMFLAFKGIEGLVGYFKNLSVELGNLGFAARYLGQSASELSRFGEVARLAGGQSQDAIAAVQGLQSAIFGLEFQGTISQNLIMLQRLGVGYLELGGQMRPLKDIALATASALEKQLPGDANRAMRVQWAAQIFGPGGLSNAIGGGTTELRKFYAESARDQKAISDKTINAQMHLQQEITRLAYDVRSEAATILSRLTPTIERLIHAIETELIPTIDELISDVMDWMHPERMGAKIAAQGMSAEGVGPLGFKHPINTFKAIGIGLGIRAAQFHEWYEKNLENFRKDKLDQITVPPQVTARLGPGTNLDALKLLHMESGGEEGDPTWSKAVTAYGSLGGVPGGAAGYVTSALGSGILKPSVPNAGKLSTPSSARPAAAPGSKPTSSTTGPRVQIGSIGPIYTQATDANRLMSELDRQTQRKFLVAQSDPGLA